MNRDCAWLLAVVLLTPVVAQAPMVSPRGWDVRLGNHYDDGPFWNDPNMARLQIHTDLAGSARTISQLGFRQGPVMFDLWNLTSTLARTVDLELLIGDSDHAKRSMTFRANYLATPYLAVTRKLFNVPAYQHPPVGGYPTPFSFVIKFDAPWSYSGKNHLCWEIRVHSNTVTKPSPFDAVLVRDYEELPGVPNGLGCVATGRSKPMELTGWARSYHDAAKHEFAWLVTDGPPFTRSTFLFGTMDPARFWPSLCTLQYVDQVFHGVHGFSNHTGTFATGPISIPYDAGLVGAGFFVQAYGIDNGRHPQLLPVSATNGLRNTVPPAPPKPVDIASLLGDLDGWRNLLDRTGLIVEFR